MTRYKAGTSSRMMKVASMIQKAMEIAIGIGKRAYARLQHHRHKDEVVTLVRRIGRAAAAGEADHLVQRTVGFETPDLVDGDHQHGRSFTTTPARATIPKRR